MLYYIILYYIILHHIYLFVCLFVRPTTLLIRCSTEAFRTRTPAPKTNNFELTMPLNAMVNAIMRQQKCDDIKSAIYNIFYLFKVRWAAKCTSSYRANYAQLQFSPFFLRLRPTAGSPAPAQIRGCNAAPKSTATTNPLASRRGPAPGPPAQVRS